MSSTYNYICIPAFKNSDDLIIQKNLKKENKVKRKERWREGDPTTEGDKRRERIYKILSESVYDELVSGACIVEHISYILVSELPRDDDAVYGDKPVKTRGYTCNLL